MTGSLRALLAGSIDYAGMFPPASLALPQALELFRRYRDNPHSWMLGRLVVPAGQLAQLAAAYEPERDGKLTVVVPAAPDRDGFVKHLDDVLEQLEKFPDRDAVDMLEFRWPVDLAGCDERDLPKQVHRSIDPPMSFFFELPASGTPSPDTQRDPAQLDEGRTRQIWRAVLALGYANSRFKLRCGGTRAGDIPSSAEVALVICACRESWVNWKATAGLHHPFRHIDATSGVATHGFLNVLCAAVLSQVHQLDERQTQAILEETDPSRFKFSDESLSWREYAVDAGRIAEPGVRRLLSFGSCSFEEPCQDLRNLGFLP